MVATESVKRIEITSNTGKDNLLSILSGIVLALLIILSQEEFNVWGYLFIGIPFGLLTFSFSPTLVDAFLFAFPFTSLFLLRLYLHLNLLTSVMFWVILVCMIILMVVILFAWHASINKGRK